MGSGNNRIYWDAAVFIAYFTQEATRTKQELAGIDQVVEAFDKGNCVLVTSILTKAELLPTRLGRENYARLSDLWKRKLFQPVEVTEAIIDLANEIRGFYAEKGEKVPATPDSIHLATAIKSGVDVFQTFDGGKKRGLLQMDGNVAGHHLAIKVPFVPQGNLGLIADAGTRSEPGPDDRA
jgi:predicted nucleic acid-binding protein